MSRRHSPEMLSQRILAGIILVRRLAVDSTLRRSALREGRDLRRAARLDGRGTEPQRSSKENE